MEEKFPDPRKGEKEPNQYQQNGNMQTCKFKFQKGKFCFVNEKLSYTPSTAPNTSILTGHAVLGDRGQCPQRWILAPDKTLAPEERIE